MRRPFLAARTSAVLLVALANVSAVQGQSQIAGLFSDRNHDFGVVARSAKAEHVFEFKNTLDRPIAITSASRSCGCVTPIIETPVVQPGETGRILAQFNTRSFLGDRKATITLSVSKPYFTQVQLHIRGYVRRDVVVNPQFVDFSNTLAGETSQRELSLSYAGSPIWQIQKIVSENPNIRIEAIETMRSGGRVKYDMTVTLDADQQWGYLSDQFILVTNDKSRRELPILVTGNLLAPIEIPSHVNLGSVAKGTTLAKTLIVKAPTAFAVTEISGDNPRIRLDKPSEKNKLHMLKIVVDTTESGSLNDTITIKTDMPNMPAAEVKFTGSVIEK